MLRYGNSCIRLCGGDHEAGLLAGCAAVTVWIMAGPTARAVDQDAVNKAIEEGVAYLHQCNVLSGVVTQPTGARRWSA